MTVIMFKYKQKNFNVSPYFIFIRSTSQPQSPKQ